MKNYDEKELQELAKRIKEGNCIPEAYYMQLAIQLFFFIISTVGFVTIFVGVLMGLNPTKAAGINSWNLLWVPIPSIVFGYCSYITIKDCIIKPRIAIKRYGGIK